MKNIEKEKNSLDIYFEEVKDHDILTKNEEIKLINKYKSGNTSAKNRLVECNLKLVIKVAKIYIDKGIDINDLIQEGNIGLIKAVEKFNLKYNCKFSTYAVWWIRLYMSRLISNFSRTIRLPVHIRDAVGKLQKNKKKFMEKHNVEPNIKELSDMTGFTIEKITKLMDVFRNTETLSLNDPAFLNLDKKNNLILDDIISDEEKIKNIDKKKVFDRIHKKIRNITKEYSKTPNRNNEIFLKRIGLKGNILSGKRTLETVGKDYGLTRERIRQISCKINKEIKEDKELIKMFKDVINR